MKRTVGGDFEECGGLVMDWRSKLYGVYPTYPADEDHYEWQYLCPSCARDRGNDPEEWGRSPRA